MPYKLRIYARSDTLSVENTRDFDLNFTNQPFLEIARAGAASERAEDARDEAQAARDTTLGYRDDADQSATVATNRASEATAARDTTLGYRNDSETFASNASASATSASGSETNAAGSASEAAGSAQDASDSATAAATSETNAADSATAAATSETNAADSATAAATSETNAAQSATDAQDAVDTIDEPTIVRDYGNQTIAGTKTFSDGVEADSYGGDGVTQSPTDTTAGRLLKVRDAGILNDSLGSEEPDDIATTRMFRGDSSANDPFSSEYMGWTFSRNSGARRTQFVVNSPGSFNCRFGMRVFDGTAWSDYVEGYHTGNLVGTVSQSGGDPTGAVIERGSNSNGQYVRFADGTQMCWGSINEPDIDIDAASGGAFRSDIKSYNFPASFSSSPSLSYSSRRTNGAFDIWNVTINVTPSDFSTLYMNIESNTGRDRTLYWQSIGRWF